MKKTITKEQLRQLVREEMINEGIFTWAGKLFPGKNSQISSGVRTQNKIKALGSTIIAFLELQRTGMNRRLDAFFSGLLGNISEDDYREISNLSNDEIKDIFDSILPKELRKNNEILNKMYEIYFNHISIPLGAEYSKNQTPNDILTNPKYSKIAEVKKEYLRQLIRSELRKQKL